MMPELLNPDVAVAISPLDDNRWKTLLTRIKNKRCTPFLGSEACFGTMPTSSEIAKDLADEYDYPFEDTYDLARVAQFVTTKLGDPFPVRAKVIERLSEATRPDFKDRNEPHRVLASLNLPLYVTTTYYDFMLQALTRAERSPRRDWCRWNDPGPPWPSAFDTYTPDVANPLVYHLHGHIAELESLVLTEDHYLDFLVQTSQTPSPIPDGIKKSFKLHCLLFLGYRLKDLEFRVLLRSLASHAPHSSDVEHLSVQVVTTDQMLSPAHIEEARAYLSKYCGNYCGKLRINVYWGTSRQFVAELRQRWEEFSDARD